MDGNVNPYTPGYNHQNGNAILYEPCAFYGAHADKLYMWLAESVKPNVDATQWTIVFRQGIQWSDGVPFTAHDAEWAMGKLITVDGLNNQGWFEYYVNSVVAIDDITLQINLKTSDYRFFLEVLTFRFDLGCDTAIQPKHIFKDVADADIPTFNFYDKAKGWPVSTGPYGVGNSSNQKTNYDLRPSWWAVDTGLVPAMPDVWRVLQEPGANETDAGQLLIDKEIDQATEMRPITCAILLAQAAHLSTWTGKKPPYGYQDWWPISIYFCTVKKPFDNPDVRWAICYAINQHAVVETAWGGCGVTANSPYPASPN